MPTKLIKVGKVVVLTTGRLAGTKAVVTNVTSGKGFPSIEVVGVSKAPEQKKRSMSTKRAAKAARCRVYKKTVNARHVITTRHAVSPELRAQLSAERLTDVAKAIVASEEDYLKARLRF